MIKILISILSYDRDNDQGKVVYEIPLLVGFGQLCFLSSQIAEFLITNIFGKNQLVT